MRLVTFLGICGQFRVTSFTQGITDCVIIFLRGNWEITRQDRHDSQIIALVPSERDIVHPDDDDYSALGMRNTVCRQSIVIIVSLFRFDKHDSGVMTCESHFAFLCFVF